MSAAKTVLPMRKPEKKPVQNHAGISRGPFREPVADVDYPHIPAGQYTLRCIAANIYFDPQFKRNVCRLAFSDPNTHNGAIICAFFNLGEGKSWKLGRRSKYWRAWVLATGTCPRRGERMGARVFEGIWFKVQVGEVLKDADQKAHSAAAIYSKVCEILERVQT